MSVPTFQKLLSKVEDAIATQDTEMRLSISAEEKLAVTLRFARNFFNNFN